VEVGKSHLELESKKKQKAYLQERKISRRITTLQIAIQSNNTNPQTPTQVCTIDRTQIMALTLATIPGITIKKPTTERIQDTTLDIIRRRIMVPAIQTITTMQTSMEELDMVKRAFLERKNYLTSFSGVVVKWGKRQNLV